MTAAPPNIIPPRRVRPYEYHSINAGKKRGDADWIVSRSDLKDILVNPEFWLKGGSPPASQTVKNGSLVDCLVTCPEELGNDFDLVRGDRLPPRYEQKERAIRKYLIKQKDIDDARAQVDSLRAKRVDEWGMTLGEMFQPGYVDTQVMARTVWREDGLEIPVRILVDVAPVDESVNWIGDVKTTRSVDCRGWRNQLTWEMNLKMQAALYLDVWNAAKIGCALNDLQDTDPEGVPVACYFLHFIVSNQAPHQSAVRCPDDDLMADGRRDYQHALRTYARCLKTGEWPGYPNSIETVSDDFKRR